MSEASLNSGKQRVAFVTGITGYLGSHLAEALLAGGWQVIGLKRRSSSLLRLESILHGLVLHDLEETDMSALFNQHGKIDAVIHTATCYGRNGESISQMLEANLAFPLRLMDAAVAAGVGLFINSDTVLDKFLNPYALSKGQFAEWGKYFAQQKKIQFLNLKLEHFYGPKDDLSKFTTHVINSCLNNVPELNLTLGEQQRDFMYIDDVVAAYILLLAKRESLEESFTEFEVGSGVAISIRQFVETVHRLTASTTSLNFGAIPYRTGEAMFSQAHTNELKALGWDCQHSLESGLKQVIEQQRKSL